MRLFNMCLLVALLHTSALFNAAGADRVCVEAEAFDETGGWLVDQQFMDVMGSPYLLAHGLGEPVLDAKMTVQFPKPGEYRVWVRTRDWVAPWSAPGAPGRFQLLVDGKTLHTTFGTEGGDWHWQDGGTVSVGEQASLALHDLTGFEGRCDAILFCADQNYIPPDDAQPLAKLRGKFLGWTNEPADGGKYDLVVVGGGIAGTSAAITAARLGLSVALIQDRPVLGGNGSSEVRVWPEGHTNLEPYPRIGDVVSELVPDESVGGWNSRVIRDYDDQRKLALATAEPNLTLLLEHRANAAEFESGHVHSVIAQHTKSGRRVRVSGNWFLDSTGDGVVGALVGADFELAEAGHLGASNQWSLGKVEQNEFQLRCLCEDDDPLSLNFIPSNEPAPFPRCPWAVDLSERDFPGRGKWRKANNLEQQLEQNGAVLRLTFKESDSDQASDADYEVRLTPVTLTWVREDLPDRDEFNGGIFVGGVDSKAFHGVVAFDLDTLPEGAEVKDASVELLQRPPQERSNEGGAEEAVIALSLASLEGINDAATWNSAGKGNSVAQQALATNKASLDAGNNTVTFSSAELAEAISNAKRSKANSIAFFIRSPDLESSPGRNFFVFSRSPHSHGPSLGDLGGWFWESGFNKDPIHDMEQIRDQNLRAMYGAWDTLKNVDGQFPNHRLKWAAYIAGKRESRRLLGDVVLSGDDFRNQTVFEDAAFPCTWDLDLHTPHPSYNEDDDPFISEAHFGKYEGPYWAPYRCLYSRNVDNLFMSGRDISVTREALGGVRVMRTCGMMGEVVGMAASICKQHQCNPRDVYATHLGELKELLQRGAGKATSTE